ncbi:MAG: trypsin-like peptidase domain-containing protein, partial [Clostridia bacterium]|nr:trypsin-like peptidase domain-containing protein [Clostridia bacterium]
KTNSGKGFKIYIGSVLTVFTISVLVLTAMVANQLVTNTTLGVDSTTITVDDSQKDKGVQITSPGVPASSSSYVAFDRTEYDGEILTIPQIAAKCSPSSVGIVSQVEVSYSYPFGFGSGTGVSEASGSGFIYSSDGYIITNHHVIEDAKKVTVILHNSAEYEAQIVGSDSLSDIAVLKINPDKDTPLIPMEIGNSDELVVGESVVAIGCPAGIEFIGTVTDGIVSAINRNVEISNDYGTNQKTMTLIQTNATINHGNSGGPLINTRGQVIGINTLKLSSSTYEGIGFSIPMNGAMPIIKQLIEHGKVIERTQDDFAYGKGVIGISGSAISEDESEYYNIPLGVLVVQIDKNSSAAKAGLRRGDIITHYNGKKVTSVDEINQAKGSARAGEQVTVTVYRDSENGYGDGETLDITFTLDAQS